VSIQITPSSVEQVLTTEAKHLANLIDELEEASYKAAQSEAAFKAEFAKHRLIAKAQEGRKTTEAQAEDEATVATAGLRLDYLIASSKVNVVRERLRVSQTRIDVARTLMASLRNVT
jgi:septal ring factor EnvC (AmiA/AmiB activator)